LFVFFFLVWFCLLKLGVVAEGGGGGWGIGGERGRAAQPSQLCSCLFSGLAFECMTPSLSDLLYLVSIKT